jgi:hypothetical protein
MYEAHQSRNNCLTQRSSGASLRSLALTTLRPLNFALGFQKNTMTNHNNSWTPEEIARAEERQKEINEKLEHEKALLKTQKSKEIAKSGNKNNEKPKKKVIVKTYKGNQAKATELFQADAVKMSTQGYVPTSQSWAAGSYGCGSFIIALLLCFLIIGFLVFIYMLLVKPEGTLSVTYELRVSTTAPKITTVSEEKACPKCAEQVKVAAQICRFCGHSFV